MKNLIYLSTYRVVLTMTVLMMVVLVIMFCELQAEVDFPDLHLLACSIVKITIDPRSSHPFLIQIRGTWVAWLVNQWQLWQEPIPETL